MTPPPIHQEASDAYRVAWSAEAPDDGFDWGEMESAMLEARREAYRSLEDLGAA